MAQRALVAMAALITATLLAGLRFGWRSWEFAGAEVVLIAVLLVGDRWLTPVLERRERGNNGEIKVAEALKAAADAGWLALHDVDTGHGNIDHVAIGPGGILTIETKSHRGKLDVGALPQVWLKQAYAQSKWIERVTGTHTEPLLVFSEAYLSRGVSRHRGVCVLPSRMLRGHLARRTGALSPEQVRSIHARLARARAEC
jgi:hypothetical protein